MSEQTIVGVGSRAADVSPTDQQFGQALTAAIRSVCDDRVKVSAIARRSGVSQSSLYAYLAGSTLPSVETLDAICGTLGPPVSRQRELATLRDRIEDVRRARRIEQASRVGPAPAAATVPDELLADPGTLFGRDAAFAQLDAAAAQSDGRPAMLALTGPAGVGKTACALAWAHRHRSDFPDGALYVDLAGYSPGEPRDAHDVLGRLLGSLGVGNSDIPGRTADRAGRLRSLLAGRRTVIVLDNAIDADHVRPLLPGTAGPFVIITSRDSLVGLAIDPGVQLAALAPLAEDAALQLLRASAPDLVGDRHELQVLARRCGGLPLALRIIGAHAGQLTGTTVAMVIDELSDGLDAFELDSGGASIREVLSWSQRRLSSSTARALALLGVLPTAVYTLGAAAAVLDRDQAVTRAELRRLARCHLLEPAGDRGYQLHDLIHEYATELGPTVLGDDRVEAAHRRLVDWVEIEGERASATLFRDEADGNPGALTHADTATIRRAQLWFEQHSELLIGLTAHTVRRHRPRDTLRVVRVIRRPLVEGRWRPHDGLVLLGAALDAAREIADEASEALVLRNLGWIHQELGDDGTAACCLEAALAAYRHSGDEIGEAVVLGNQAALHLKVGRMDLAVELYEQALHLAEGQDCAKAVAAMRNNLALCAMKAGDAGRAREHSLHALGQYSAIGAGHGVARTHALLAEIAIALDDPVDAEREIAAALNWARTITSADLEVECLNVLGELRASQRDWIASRRCFGDALVGADRVQDSYERARALEGIGRCDRQDGDFAHAQLVWTASATLFATLGSDDEKRVRGRLGELGRADSDAAADTLARRQPD